MNVHFPSQVTSLPLVSSSPCCNFQQAESTSAGGHRNSATNFLPFLSLPPWSSSLSFLGWAMDYSLFLPFYWNPLSFGTAGLTSQCLRRCTLPKSLDLITSQRAFLWFISGSSRAALNACEVTGAFQPLCTLRMAFYSSPLIYQLLKETVCYAVIQTKPQEKKKCAQSQRRRPVPISEESQVFPSPGKDN